MSDLTLSDILKKSHMLQVILGSYSLRVRRNRYFSGQFYITIRNISSTYEDDKTFVAKNREEVSHIVSGFLAGEL